jgi:hypothetical protein
MSIIAALSRRRKEFEANQGYSKRPRPKPKQNKI